MWSVGRRSTARFDCRTLTADVESVSALTPQCSSQVGGECRNRTPLAVSRHGHAVIVMSRGRRHGQAGVGSVLVLAAKVAQPRGRL